MGSKIVAVSSNTYQLKARGHDMLLERTGDGGWRMTVENASSRAWRAGGGYRYFDSLVQVEAAYKTWAGVLEFVAQHKALEAIQIAKQRCHARHFPGAQWQVFRDKGL